MSQVVTREFVDQLADTPYPFSDASDLRAHTGFRLDYGIIQDAAIYIPGEAVGLSLTSLTISPRSAVFGFGTPTSPDMVSGSCDPLEPVDAVALTDARGQDRGTLALNTARVGRLSAWTYDTHLFSAAELVATVVLPLPATGVQTLAAASSAGKTGDVWLYGEGGVVVRHVSGEIRFDVTGDPLFLRRLCEPVELFQNQSYLKTINGCPGRNGRFDLLAGTSIAADSVLRVYATDNGLRVEAAGAQILL